ECDGLSYTRGNSRGRRTWYRGHGGLVATCAAAPGRLAVVDRLRAPRGPRARAGSHRPARLRPGPAGPARRGAPFLSPGGPLDRRTAPVAARAGGRRAGRPVRGGADELPRGTLAPGPRTTRTVPVLAGEGVPSGPRDPDQEDRDVTSSECDGNDGSAAIESLAPRHDRGAAWPSARRGDAPRPSARRRSRGTHRCDSGGRLDDPSDRHGDSA